MSIERINLIPIERRMVHRQRASALRWAVACGLYAAAAVAIAPALSQAGAGSRAMEAQQRRLERDIEVVARTSAELAREHQELVRRSRLIHELGGSADWGRLISAVAATIASDAALEGLRLAPRKDEPGYILQISGMAVSQRTITQTALQLEKLSVEGEPLFASVTITDSRRRMIGATPAVTFSIECVLHEPGESDGEEDGQ